MSFWSESEIARSCIDLANATSGASASISFLRAWASAAVSAARAASRLARASRSRAFRFSLSSSASTWPASTRWSTSTASRSMMPLAFDLISTLVIGSIFPVATTDRVIVPRSTVASRDGSMVVDAPFSVDM